MLVACVALQYYCVYISAFTLYKNLQPTPNLTVFNCESIYSFIKQISYMHYVSVMMLFKHSVFTCLYAVYNHTYDAVTNVYRFLCKL